MISLIKTKKINLKEVIVMKSSSLILLLFLLTCTFANTVTFKFEGYIDVIEENTDDEIFYEGQYFEGYFSYSLVPDQEPRDGDGEYNQNASLSVTLDSTILPYFNDFVYLRVNNNSSYFNADRFLFSVDNSQGDYNFYNFGLELLDSSSSVFDSDALPINLNLTAFDTNIFYFYGSDTSYDNFEAKGHITQLKLIPEPCSVALVGIGGFLVFWRKLRV